MVEHIASSNEAANEVVCGFVAPGFEEVRALFERSFARGEETGAAVAVYLGGQAVVDLWGGRRIAGTTERWQRDTLALVFSTTKGLAAMALALAHSRGWLDYEARVADYWPEFSCHGKEHITVRQLLAHQAGLSAIDVSVTPELLADHDVLARVLARQRPRWTPGLRNGYHPLSLGLYQNELMRRVDPQRRTIGEVLRQEIALPLAADAFIGLPDSVPDEQLARLEQRESTAQRLRSFRIYPLRFLLAVMLPGHITQQAFANPKMRSLEELDSRAWLRLQMASVNAVANARGIARMYGEFATGGKRLGLRRATLELLEAPALPPARASSSDALLYIDAAYSLGFWKPCGAFRFGSDVTAYGTPGAGGSVGFADPTLGLGFGYVPNRLGLHMIEDPRAQALRAAVYRCARATPLRSPSFFQSLE